MTVQRDSREQDGEEVNRAVHQYGNTRDTFAGSEQTENAVVFDSDTSVQRSPWLVG